ncbi:type VII secretion-associated serine protease mycosin [Streptomyces sp. DJ]|nr:type VII secretion-associated serine protease mycosin [Streptomyces sp. DJ]
MTFGRSLRSAGSAFLAGSLIFLAAPSAAADLVRQNQWVLEKLEAEKIWEISQGEGVTVAVIDDGFDTKNQDLRENLLKGKDFVDGGSVDPAEGDVHGTDMASIIAAHGHGSQGRDGVKGLAPKAKILPIRSDLSSGWADSIYYAVDQGASVINISVWSSRGSSQDAEAMAYALEKDVLVVTASGNEGESGSIGYPGWYPGVLTVGAVDEEGEIWSKSNYGSEVMLTAPGVGILTPKAGNSGSAYHVSDGTSSSAAHVSAAAALIRAKYPDLTAGQVVNRLTKTAGLPDSAKGTSLPDEKYGYGYIRPLAALTENIPAGSKYGPLKVPESLQSSSPESGSGGDSGSDSGAGSNNTLKRILVFVVAPVFLLLVVVTIVFVIVRIFRRKNNRTQTESGWHGSQQGQPSPYGQAVPPGNTGGFPPQQQGSNQNQSSGPWGP